MKNSNRATMTASEFSTGKTIVVLGIVIGCFAVLWPKVFYPMFQASIAVQPYPSSQAPKSCHQTLLGFQGDQFFLKLCANALDKGSNLEEKLQLLDKKDFLSKEMLSLCQDNLLRVCGINITNATVKHKDAKKMKQLKVEFFKNLSVCLEEKSSLLPKNVGKKIAMKNYLRPERPPHLRPDILHPALRERGKAIPPNMRDPDRPPRGSPVPGMRPIMGASPHVNPQHKGSGSMGIIMPIYTIGIVVFFLYTIMKVLFKKEPDKTPKVLDFHMDPEHRKYILSEEYNNTNPISLRDTMRRQEGLKKRNSQANGNKLEDAEIDHLKQRLAETEAAMERIMQHMGTVSDKLTSSQIQASFQDVLLKKLSIGEEADSSNDQYESTDDAETDIDAESDKDVKADDGKKHIQFSPTPEYMDSEPEKEEEEEEKPSNFVLDTNLPSDLHVLVSEAHCEAVSQSDSESNMEGDPPATEAGVIISGKMTLSLIGVGDDELESERPPVSDTPEAVDELCEDVADCQEEEHVVNDPRKCQSEE